MSRLVKKLSLLLTTLAVFLFGFFFTAQANQAFAHTLSGNVSDSSGTDIIGADVNVIDVTTSNSVGSDTTDINGNYSISVTNGTFDIEVTPPGGSEFGPALASDRTISGDTVVNFILAAAGSVALSGHIYDASGDPLPNVEVKLEGANGNVTNTNSSGFYSVTAAPGTYTIKISSPTYDTTASAPLNYRFTANNYSLTSNTPLDITLPAQEVIVHVQDNNFTSIEDVRVETSQFQEQTYTFGGINFTGFSHYNNGPTPFTNSSGDAVLWLFPGNYQLITLPPSGSIYASPGPSSIVVTDDMQTTITLISSVALSGYIYDALGDPLPNVEVKLEGPNGNVTNTNSLGFYSVTAASGTYTIKISSPTYDTTASAPLNYRFTASNYSLTSNTPLDITLPTKEVTVHVQDTTNPIEQVRVETSQFEEQVYTFGGINFTGFSHYNNGPTPFTNSSGDAVLWLFPGNYQLITLPPAGSIYAPTMSNVFVDSDQTVIISLQYNHAAPVTTIDLETQNPDDTYSDPTTVTLSATASAGYTVANIYYKVDGSSQQTYTAPFEVTGVGDHSVEYWSVDNSGVQEAHKTENFTVQNQEPVTTTFDSSADTYVRSGQPNQNEGAGLFMRIQQSGSNRSLVRFSQAALQSAVGSGTVLSAKLRVTIVDNGNNWGTTGRTVDVHRFVSDWVEGNGTESDRGAGPGATWSCAIDSLIENQAKNCTGVTEWEMGQPNNPAVHPWVEQSTDSESITNGQTGIVEYDVTADVQSFINGTTSNYGWIIKKTEEGQAGQVSFGTKESANIPQLVVTYQP